MVSAMMSVVTADYIRIGSVETGTVVLIVPLLFVVYRGSLRGVDGFQRL